MEDIKFYPEERAPGLWRCRVVGPIGQKANGLPTRGIICTAFGPTESESERLAREELAKPKSERKWGAR